MKAAISKSGQCPRCARVTEWEAHDGWVFHTIAKHWRCSKCHCATEPQLFLDLKTMTKLRREEALRLLDHEEETT